MRVFRLAALGALCWCVSWPAQAAPDWTGIYDISGGPAGGPKLPGYTPVNPDLDPVVMAHLQPWATELMNSTDTEADDTGAVCKLAGLFRHPTTVAGFEVLHLPGAIYLVSTDLQQVAVRRITLTDHHPATIAPSWNGNSIGHWEGDTLIVDTIGFNDKSWLMSGREPHTEELHLIERIHAVAGGQGLEIDSTVEDRKALTSPYSFSRFYVKTNHEFTDVHEICNGEPGEPKRWNDIRKAAIERQLHPQPHRSTLGRPVPQ